MRMLEWEIGFAKSFQTKRLIKGNIKDYPWSAFDVSAGSMTADVKIDVELLSR
jgi:hypothetical protein